MTAQDDAKEAAYEDLLLFAWQDDPHRAHDYLSKHHETIRAALQSAAQTVEMTNDQIRLHFGELTANECRLVRAAIRWANSGMDAITEGPTIASLERRIEGLRDVLEMYAEGECPSFYAKRALETDDLLKENALSNNKDILIKGSDG